MFPPQLRHLHGRGRGRRGAALPGTEGVALPDRGGHVRLVSSDLSPLHRGGGQVLDHHHQLPGLCVTDRQIIDPLLDG